MGKAVAEVAEVAVEMGVGTKVEETPNRSLQNEYKVAKSTYEVVLKQRTGLFVEDRTVKVVDKSSCLHGLLLPDSVVLKINDTVLSDGVTFEKVFWQADLPVKLVLHGPLESEELPTQMHSDTREITKEVLITLIICYFSAFIDLFGMMVTNPVLPFLLPIMEFDDTQLGLLNSIYNAAMIIGALVIGVLMSRYGTRTAILFSLLGSAITLAAQGVLVQVVMNADDPTDSKYYMMFLFLRLAAGTTGSSMPVVMTYIGMRVPLKEKPKHMAIAASCMTSAIVAGPIVGGTLSNFSPRFALPFYVGAAFAFSFFLVALIWLGNAKKPPQAGKKNRFSKPLCALLVVAPLKMLTFGAFIVMGPAYMMWKFNLKPEEVGSVLSLHGVSVVANQFFLTPFLIKRLCPERVLLLSSFMMVCGSSIVGLMPNWWSFQLVIALCYGLGFSTLVTTLNVSCDKFATNATRPAMNSALFMIDQFSLFISGIAFGKVLEISKTLDWSALFWYVDCGIASALFLSLVLVYCCILTPNEAKRRMIAEKSELASSQHNINPSCFEELDPEEPDYLEVGKHVVDLLHSRNWAWRKKRDYINELLDLVLIELPTDTMEHRMEVIWDLREKLQHASKNRKEIDQFYEELGQFTSVQPS